jgi:hypothetical protein
MGFGTANKMQNKVGKQVELEGVGFQFFFYFYGLTFERSKNKKLRAFFMSFSASRF